MTMTSIPRSASSTLDVDQSTPTWAASRLAASGSRSTVLSLFTSGFLARSRAWRVPIRPAPTRLNAHGTAQAGGWKDQWRSPGDGGNVPIRERYARG